MSDKAKTILQVEVQPVCGEGVWVVGKIRAISSNGVDKVRESTCSLAQFGF